MEEKNIVMVTVDSLRADHCGFMGSELGLTPRLDELASEGVVYENAFTQAGSTRSSTGTFLTGRYPHDRPTATSTQETVEQHFAAEDTLPERLRRLGYNTAVFTANPWTSRFYLDENLFDHFEDYLETTEGDEADGQSKEKKTTLASRLMNWWKGQDMFMTWEAMYEKIETWLEDADEPFFCWIFIVDPHMPYLAPKPYRTRSQIPTYLANASLFSNDPSRFSFLFDEVLESAYRDTIRYTDDFIAKLHADLEEHDPVMLVHADHGEVFNEGGTYGHGNIHEGIIHVPFVISGGPTERVREPFSLQSVPDLVTDIAATGSVSPREFTEEYVRTRLRGPERVIRGDGWKYVLTATDEHVYRVEDGEEIEIDDEELREIGRREVYDWEQADEDRRAVMAAAASLVADESV